MDEKPKKNGIWRWLTRRGQLISTAVALASLAVALLSTVASALQAGLLYTQRATPYRTAIYVRQLEVAGRFAAAANDQAQRVNEILRLCGRVANGAPLRDEAFYGEVKAVRLGLEALNQAYFEAQVGFGENDQPAATSISNAQQRLFNLVIGPAENCTALLELYRDNGGAALVRDIGADTEDIVASLRTQLAIDNLSSAAPVVEARKRGAQSKPTDDVVLLR